MSGLRIQASTTCPAMCTSFEPNVWAVSQTKPDSVFCASELAGGAIPAGVGRGVTTGVGEVVVSLITAITGVIATVACCAPPPALLTPSADDEGPFGSP